MKHTLLLAAATALSAILAGCQNTVNTVENQNKTMTPNVIQDTRFVTDSFLRDRLALTSLVTSETQQGFMKVQLTAVNMRVSFFSQLLSGFQHENPYNIRYKFTWFTQDGMAVDTILSDWQDKRIIPGDTVYLQSVAPTKECKDFKVSLVEGK